jgi:hypothetical protein
MYAGMSAQSEILARRNWPNVEGRASANWPSQKINRSEK